MHASRVPKTADPALEEFRAGLGAPSIACNLQAERGLQAWMFLAWSCGCAASYVAEYAADAASDVEVARCRKHDW